MKKRIRNYLHANDHIFLGQKASKIMISLISFFGNKKHSPLFYYIHSRLLVGERSGQEEYEHESLVLTSIPLQSNTRLEGISAFYMDGINSVLCAIVLNGRSEVNFQKEYFYKFIFKQ